MSILQPGDITDLIKEGLLRLDSPQGTQRIHNSRLNPYGDVEYSHLSLSAPESNMFSIIPITLISLETVKYLGYGEESATKIWDRWITRAPRWLYSDSEYDELLEKPFITSVIDYLAKGRHLDTKHDDDQQWRDFMNFCGINQETQATILHPTSCNARWGNSYLVWLQDAIKRRYWSLKAVQMESQKRANAIQRAAPCPQPLLYSIPIHLRGVGERGMKSAS